MEKSVKICFIDRMWYNSDHKEIVGDMGFSFEDAVETRKFIKDYDELAQNARDWFDDPYSDWEKFDGNGDFAIYEVVVADAIYDEEYLLDDENPEEDEGMLSGLSIENREVKEVICGIRESQLTDDIRKAIEKEYKKDNENLFSVAITYLDEEDE